MILEPAIKKFAFDQRLQDIRRVGGHDKCIQLVRLTEFVKGIAVRPRRPRQS
jgi:hypothetical protein